MSGSPLDRRTLLRLAGAAALTAGCRGAEPGASPSLPLPAPTPQRRPSRLPSPTPPALQRYRVLPGEPLPNLKQVAADFVQTLTTRTAGESP